ncbi:MAG: GtrA family protein [Campylobacter sp.]
MGISYIVNLIVMSIFYRIFDVNVYISQLLGGVTYTFTGYILSKKWIFCTNDFKKRI